MSANLSSCSPTRVLQSRVLWGSGTRQSWVQKQRVEMPLSFIADWREAGSCWEHTLLRPGVGPGARTECCTGISWGDAVLARQARVCCPGLQPAVPGAALLHTARRPHPGLPGGGHGLCTRPAWVRCRGSYFARGTLTSGAGCEASARSAPWASEGG